MSRECSAQSAMSGRITVTEYDGSLGSRPRAIVRRGGSSASVAGLLQRTQRDSGAAVVTGEGPLGTWRRLSGAWPSHLAGSLGGRRSHREARVRERSRRGRMSRHHRMAQQWKWGPGGVCPDREEYEAPFRSGQLGDLSNRPCWIRPATIQRYQVWAPLDGGTSGASAGAHGWRWTTFSGSRWSAVRGDPHWRSGDAASTWRGLLSGGFARG